MYINDRGEMNFHKFIKSSREVNLVNQKKAAEGICTSSEWARVEVGDRLPEKMMRDRIVSRTGISGDEFEEYLRPEEYLQWEWRMHTLYCIKKDDVEGAKLGIETLDGFPNQNPVQKQFVDTMRYMVARIEGASRDTLSIMIDLVVAHTIPSVEYALKGTQLLADQELNLIAEYARVYDYKGENHREWSLDLYKKVLHYIDHSAMDALSKAKVYPRVAYLISELILATDSTERELRYAYGMCHRAIELLRDTQRLYYFVELLECRKRLNIRIQGLPIRETERVRLRVLYEKDSKWENVLKELYRRYDISYHMHNFTYLYEETVCESAIETIRTRRNMFKISRARLTNDLCAEKTLERAENYMHSMSILLQRDFFERIGLCAEYRRTKIVTDKVELIELNNKLTEHISNGRVAAAEACLRELKSKLNMDISYNKQEIQKSVNRIELCKKILDRKTIYKNALVALEHTVPFVHVIRMSDKYFTRSEIECMCDLAFKVNGEVSGTCYELLLDMCEKALKKPLEVSKLSMYEPIMLGFIQSWLCQGKYEASHRYSERLMKECLSNYRSTVLVDCLYNKTCVYEMLSGPYDFPSKFAMIQSFLEDGIILSEIARRETWTSFLQTRLSANIND